MRKYFTYAIGEILLVVIGILIALQINNWNEYRKERYLEKELLLQLQSEFQSNLNQLDQKINIRKTMIRSALKLLDYQDNKSQRNKDSILNYISYTYLAPTFDPVLNDLTSSGRIQFIRSSELKESLSRWTSDVIQVIEVEKSWLAYRNKFYLPVLHQRTSMRDLINQYWMNKTNNIFHLNQEHNDNLSIGNSLKPIDISNLFESPEFENTITWCAHYSKMINIESMAVKESIKKILQQIEVELQKL